MTVVRRPARMTRGTQAGERSLKPPVYNLHSLTGQALQPRTRTDDAQALLPQMRASRLRQPFGTVRSTDVRPRARRPTFTQYDSPLRPRRMGRAMAFSFGSAIRSRSTRSCGPGEGVGSIEATASHVTDAVGATPGGWGRATAAVARAVLVLATRIRTCRNPRSAMVSVIHHVRMGSSSPSLMAPPTSSPLRA